LLNYFTTDIEYKRPEQHVDDSETRHNNQTRSLTSKKIYSAARNAINKIMIASSVKKSEDV